MQLPTATGGNVPLSSVADVYTELSPQSIARKNQKETVTITGESESGDANAITEKVNEVLDSYETPDGVEIGDGDTMASQMAETTGSLMLALAVAIALVYFILATQFNSFALTIAIMLILPIGLLGSMMLLAPTGNHVSMVALLGVIILAGTVVNSSIVLIDYTLQRRERGEDKNTAILNACPRRVRPSGPDDRDDHHPRPRADGILERRGSEMMKPMGIVMMTGMVISTVATLFITPVYYSLTDSIAERLKKLVHLPHRKGGKGRKGGGSGRTRRKPGFCRINPPDYRCKKSVKYCMIGVSTPESGNGCVSAAVFPAFRQILREGRPQSMKRWPVAAAVLAACLTGCAGETTATVNPQTQALERAEQAGLLRKEGEKAAAAQRV